MSVRKLLLAAGTVAVGTAALVRVQRGSQGSLGRAGCFVHDLDTTDEDHWRLSYRCGGEDVGTISVVRSEIPGEIGRDEAFVIDRIDVKPAHRRKRYATRLYEAAAAEACRRGGPLFSDTRIGGKSEQFWFKQLRKGRAHVNHEATEANFGEEVIVLPCPAPKDLSGLGRAPIKLRCEPLFTAEELKDLPPTIRRLELAEKHCRYRQRRRFRAARFRHKHSGDELIIHPSTKLAGKCQASYIDDRGPYRDTQYSNCAEAVADVSPRQWDLIEVKR